MQKNIKSYNKLCWNAFKLYHYNSFFFFKQAHDKSNHTIFLQMQINSFNSKHFTAILNSTGKKIWPNQYNKQNGNELSNLTSKICQSHLSNTDLTLNVVSHLKTNSALINTKNNTKWSQQILMKYIPYWSTHIYKSEHAAENWYLHV